MENLELEFKRCAALEDKNKKKDFREELCKDVSAFANSAGGTIIYGMIEDGHVAIELDVGFDPSTRTKEWTEQVLNSGIHRKIAGLRIRQVELLTTHPGMVAYVIRGNRVQSWVSLKDCLKFELPE